MAQENELQVVGERPNRSAEMVEADEFPLFMPGQTGIGQIQIKLDVIARIAGIAVSEIEGVSIGNRFSITDIFPGKEAVKGIHVEESDEGKYRITTEVKIAYKTPMQETAVRLQRHVKDTVERMTGLPIQAVDVKIIDIYLEKKEEEEE